MDLTRVKFSSVACQAGDTRLVSPILPIRSLELLLPGFSLSSFFQFLFKNFFFFSMGSLPDGYVKLNP